MTALQRSKTCPACRALLTHRMLRDSDPSLAPLVIMSAHKDSWECAIEAGTVVIIEARSVHPQPVPGDRVQAERTDEEHQDLEEDGGKEEEPAGCALPESALSRRQTATGLRNVYAHGRKFRAKVSELPEGGQRGGERKRKTVGRFDTPAEAALAVAQHEAEIWEGEGAENGRPSLWRPPRSH
jgi:hypothetical protein